jgi:hypothetical protein
MAGGAGTSRRGSAPAAVHPALVPARNAVIAASTVGKKWRGSIVRVSP